MKNLLLSAIILFSFTTCNNQEEKSGKEKNSHNDSTKESKVDTVLQTDSTLIQDDISIENMNLDEKIIAFTNSLSNNYNNQGESNKEEHILSVSNSVKQSILLKKKTEISYGDVKGIFPLAHVFFYSFDNEEKCTETFSKWLDCFGGECDKIAIGQDVKAIKMPPMYVIKNPTEIIVLKYLCEHQENNWDDFKQKLDKIFKTDESIIINIDCGGPLSWK